MFNKNYYHGYPDLNEADMAAKKLGLQSWFRQFQPSFSPDPMVLPELEKGFHRFGSRLPWDYGKVGINARGPLAKYTPGNPSFETWRFGDVPLPPARPFSRDDIFGTSIPFAYENLWESDQAYNNRMFPPPPRT